MTRSEEAHAILALVGGDFSRAIQMVHDQFNVLYTRAQVFIGIASVVLTITGFSGRLIAATNRPAQVLIIIGVALVLASAFYIVHRIMRIRWVTSELSDDPHRTLDILLERRDQRTDALHRGGVILFCGLAFYFLAFALMLLNPEPVNAATR